MQGATIPVVLALLQVHDARTHADIWLDSMIICFPSAVGAALSGKIKTDCNASRYR